MIGAERKNKSLGEGAKDDEFFGEPLVVAARRLAKMVLTPPSKKG